MSSESAPSTHRVVSAADLEALIGEHVTGEGIEEYGVDPHGLFQFATEIEAHDALSDPFFQRFLPAVDWSKTVIRKQKVYPQYSSNPIVLWKLIEKTSAQHGPLIVVKKQGRWWASFGNAATRDARSVGVSICLAALDATGLAVEIDHDRIDAELGHRPGELEEEEPQAASDSTR